MKAIIVGVAAVLLAGMAAAAFVKPTELWEKNNTRCIDESIAPFIPMKEKTNVIEVPSEGELHKFKFVFVTTDEKEIPAYIEGMQREELDREVGKWGELDGITRTGEQWKDDYVAVYVSVVFEEECELDHAVITGPNDYRIVIDLDAFWGTDHKFKKGEKYGFGWYL